MNFIDFCNSYKLMQEKLMIFIASLRHRNRNAMLSNFRLKKKKFARAKVRDIYANE